MEKQSEEEFQRLILALEDHHRDIRSRAAYELGKQGDTRAIAPLSLALSDKDKFVRSWAADALSKFGVIAIEPLRTVLETADLDVSCYAALALGEIGALCAVPYLVQMLQAGDREIRSRAAGVLEKLGNANTLPCRVLGDGSLPPPQRLEILTALRQAAYHDEQIHLAYPLPDLAEFCEQHLRAEDAAVRAGARATLDALQNAAPSFSSPGMSGAGAAPEGSASCGSELPVSQAQTSEADTSPLTGGKPERSLWARLLRRDSDDE